VQLGRLRTAIGDADAYQDVLGGGLGVLDKDVEVAALIEDTGVGQLELTLSLPRARFSSMRR